MKVLPNISFLVMTDYHALSFCFLITNQLTIKPILHNLGFFYSSIPFWLQISILVRMDDIRAKTKRAKNNSHLTPEFNSHLYYLSNLNQYGDAPHYNHLGIQADRNLFVPYFFESCEADKDEHGRSHGQWKLSPAFHWPMMIPLSHMITPNSKRQVNVIPLFPW